MKYNNRYADKKLKEGVEREIAARSRITPAKGIIL